MALVNVEAREHVLLIGLNRPEKMNAMNREMYHTIAAAYGRLAREPGLRVGLVHAEGEHFTSGLQLDDWAETFAAGKGMPLGKGEIDPFCVVGEPLSKPVVFATQGICFPCGGATFRLPEEIGWGNAQRYLLTGDEWSAQQAFDWGLVQELVEPGEQFDRAWQIAQKVARAAPLGVQGSLASSRLARVQGHSAAKKELFAALEPVMASEDVKEGIRSFLERREAEFKGK